MNKQQFIEKSNINILDLFIENPKGEFQYKGKWYSSKFGCDLIDHLVDISNSALSECWDMAGEEKDNYWISKLNMIALGALTFKESEVERDKEEMKGLRRRDGGPAMAAFSFINRLIETINSLTSQKEGKENLISLKDMIDEKECENCGTDTEQHTCVDCEQDIPSYICEKYKGMCPHCSWLIGK